MGEEIKTCLSLYRSYIEKILRPTYLLGYMGNWFQDDAIEQIKHEEQKGPTTAAALFLEKLLTLDAEGWYQGFLDGLHAAGYTGLYEALQRSDFTDIEYLDEARKHLSIIQSTVTNNINPEEILSLFRDCLLNREIEEILQETRLKGPTAGAEKFVDCLLRSDKKEWPKVFSLAMEQEDCMPVLEVWAKKKDKGKAAKSEEEEEGESSAFNFVQYAEDPEPGKPCFSAPVGIAHDNKTTAVPEMNSILPGDTLTPHPILTLRKYQEELARPAYNGKNTIICAPTGSGKTLVALSICEHHLKSKPEGDRGKVVFMATKLPVYEQQKDIFCKYFAGTGYKVVGFCGESPENLPIGLMIENSDIIVLTPQILVNCLQNGRVPSLSMFSLIIFDECHNTTGSHPYNVLMFAYIDMKLSSPNAKRPQIIGLTASVGTGKSKCLDEATSYVLKLCASLDVEVISTVEENLEELKSFVYTPEKLIQETERRENDPFLEIMSGIMAETEKMAKSVFPELDSLSNIQKKTYGTQTYEQWITNTQNRCRILQMENKMEEARICKALFTYTEHLRKYNDSIIINEDARTKDALDYLKTFFENVKNGSYNRIEQCLTRNFEAKLPSLEKISADNINPKLDEVQFILNEAYHESPETRTLLFVKTRALVSALKKWIEETPTLCFLKPEVLIGRNKRNDSLGMTLLNLKGALETFKSSEESKLLIATSVADEGIDIPACNLVLLYEYVGNVTKMIQVRGRGRAKDSKCILVTCKRDEAEKERNNLLHETLMTRAVLRLQKLDNRDFLIKIQQIQKEEKKQRDFKKIFKGLSLSDENKRLLCGKCKIFACNTDDIRVIQESHHTVIDNKFKDRYTTQPHPKPRGFSGYTKKFKIFCRNKECKEDWGVSGTYQSFQNIPLIKIEKFVVESENGNQEYFSKWVKVDFKMKQFRIEEISEAFSTALE
ncbi:antiviral innate immune response receptor RIG-I [Spea bombifrons]|uniref:antiviral innate immune response receptor RIG-I n=1 Tax=Spea bombifrons TaxID=233779 RepID=UPI00234B854A|nr:antiviral innate immune response receptor RIG-I [Spea bombifrons]